MKYLVSTLCCLAIAMASSFAQGQTISNVPVTEDGTAFSVGTTSLNYNEAALIIGGSTSPDISTFNTLIFFDTTGLTTDSGGAVAAGDITGGSLSFTVNNAGGGVHSGNVEVHFLGSIATIPVQDGGNNSPSDQELVALSEIPGTLLFSGPLGVDESETLDLAGDVDNDLPILLFRFTDPNPAPTENQQSGITIDNLDLLVAGGGPLLGDVNLDGSVSLLDVAPFVDRIANNMFQAEADINQDGFVDLLDVALFVAILAGG